MAKKTEKCYTCEHMFGSISDGEVFYAKPGVWSCVGCHLVQRKLEGKGTAGKIQQQCGRCQGDRSGDRGTIAAWFGYYCRQYLCQTCGNRHSKHVSE